MLFKVELWFFNLLGLILSEKKQPLEALEYYNKGLEIDPKNSTYSYQKGMIFIYLNNNGDAENEFKKALSIDEKNIDAAYQLAYLYATQNKKELSKL